MRSLRAKKRSMRSREERASRKCIKFMRNLVAILSWNTSCNKRTSERRKPTKTEPARSKLPYDLIAFINEDCSWCRRSRYWNASPGALFTEYQPDREEDWRRAPAFPFVSLPELLVLLFSTSLSLTLCSPLRLLMKASQTVTRHRSLHLLSLLCRSLIPSHSVIFAFLLFVSLSQVVRYFLTQSARI